MSEQITKFVLDTLDLNGVRPNFQGLNVQCKFWKSLVLIYNTRLVVWLGLLGPNAWPLLLLIPLKMVCSPLCTHCPPSNSSAMDCFNSYRIFVCLKVTSQHLSGDMSRIEAILEQRVSQDTNIYGDPQASPDTLTGSISLPLSTCLFTQ